MMMIEEHETVWANDAPKATRHSHDLILLGSSRQTGIVIFSADGVGFVDTTPRWRIVPWYSMNVMAEETGKRDAEYFKLLVFKFKFKTKMNDGTEKESKIQAASRLTKQERILLGFHQPPLVE